MSTFTIAISGASGAPYAVRLIEVLVKAGHALFISISKEGLSILKDEAGIALAGSEAEIHGALRRRFGATGEQVRYFDEGNMYSPIASGSVKVDAMVVVPCSMKTLSGIANGYATNLIERAADVTIKEKRKLIIVPRETPLSAIHLRNMLTLSELGCHVIPAMPAFYHHPKQVSEMVDFVVSRVLDSMGVENSIAPRWGG